MASTRSSHLLTNSEPSDLAAKLWERLNCGIRLADRLEATGNALNSKIALVLSDKLRLCLRPENVWFSDDFYNPDGDVFEASGVLAGCRSQLCPFCGLQLRRPLVNKTITAIEALRPNYKRFPFHITLTCPSLPAMRFLEQFEFIKQSWSRLRKMQWWIKTVLGGIKVTESTTNEQTGSYNIHIHILAFCNGRINQSDLSSIWTETLIRRAREDAIDLAVNTRSGFVNVHIKPTGQFASTNRFTKNSLLFARALEVSARYLFKGINWGQLNDRDLVSVVELKQLPRLTDTFGKLRSISRSILDYKQASDGAQKYQSHTVKLRTRRSRQTQASLSHLSREEWQFRLAEQSARTSEYRKKVLFDKYPLATIKFLSE